MSKQLTELLINTNMTFKKSGIYLLLSHPVESYRSLLVCMLQRKGWLGSPMHGSCASHWRARQMSRSWRTTSPTCGPTLPWSTTLTLQTSLLLCQHIQSRRVCFIVIYLPRPLSGYTLLCLHFWYTVTTSIYTQCFSGGNNHLKLGICRLSFREWIIDFRLGYGIWLCCWSNGPICTTHHIACFFYFLWKINSNPEL